MTAAADMGGSPGRDMGGSPERDMGGPPGRGPGVPPDFLAYAEFQAFWDRFSPETPFGREEKEGMPLVRDAAELERLWDGTQTALALLEELERDPARLSRVSHHLKRMPRFPLEERDRYGEVELFQFKKFMFNFQALADLVGPRAREAFGLSFTSQAFARLLDRGRQSAESFYVADDYSPDLKAVRQEIRELDLRTKAEREGRDREIQARFGFTFGPRAFALVPRGRLGDLDGAAALLRLEPHDEIHVMVRPLATARELILAERREVLQARERVLEGEVLAELSRAARGELEALKACMEAARAFDLAFARARLAREWGLTRPRLGEGPVRVQGGRLLPCEEACRARGLGYTPLEACFDTPATVIFGSNMGGKTVVLKTLAFLQLCAQTGLFVPAARFETRAFRHFHYVGEGRDQEAALGLSGFGREIRQFNGAWGTLDEPTLVLFDEFARTTQSLEAEALLSAVLASLGERPGAFALFSTHFRGVARLEGVRYLRMGGLRPGGAGTGQDPLRLIGERMDYRLLPDGGAPASSDALAVAELLGLDPAVLARTRQAFNHVL